MRSAGRSMQSEIRKMVERIVREFRPAKVVLFGSHARGEAGPDSDVDLLVVMDYMGSKRERQLAIRLALHEFPIAKDIVVTTPEELAWRKEIPGTIERLAEREGTILYASPDRVLAVAREWVRSGFRYALVRNQGRRRFSIAHPSIPSRWEGKKYRLSNDLFPLPTGGGEGVGDPIQTLSLFQHR